MSVQATTPRRTQQSASFAELFTPKLVTVLREGYSLANLRTDAISGLTVAIVAPPLSMAIAIASGATPAQGLYTAIAGGFLSPPLAARGFRSAVPPPRPSSIRRAPMSSRVSPAGLIAAASISMSPGPTPVSAAPSTPMV